MTARSVRLAERLQRSAGPAGANQLASMGPVHAAEPTRSRIDAERCAMVCFPRAKRLFSRAATCMM